MSKQHYHIIIKFTPNDNISGANQEKGWVDYFADFLKTQRLKKYLKLLLVLRTFPYPYPHLLIIDFMIMD